MTEDQNQINKKQEPSAGSSAPADNAVNPEQETVLNKPAQVPTTEVQHEAAPVGPRPPRTRHAHLLDANSIAFYIGDNDDPLMVRVTEQIVLGRSGPLNERQPSLDLTPYRAVELGVSRLHATIRRQQHALFLEDMSSSNGSYLNGKRIAPSVPQRLLSGDVIALGRLTLEVYFRSASSPTEPSATSTRILDLHPMTGAPLEATIPDAKAVSAPLVSAKLAEEVPVVQTENVQKPDGIIVLQAIPGTIRFSVPNVGEAIPIEGQLVMFVRKGAEVDSPQSLEIQISTTLNRTEPRIKELLERVLKFAKFDLTLK